MKEQVVGIDIGYGATKVAYQGKCLRPFPSVQGQAVPIRHQEEQILSEHPGERLIDDAEWFIGNLAVLQLPPSSQVFLRGVTRDEKHQGMQFRKRQVLAAIAKLFPGARDVVHVALGTGLPVSHIRQNSGILKETLLGQHRVKTHESDFVLSIDKIQVMPEPYGGLYRNLLNQDGGYNKTREAAIRAVLNVGMYTVDVAVMNELAQYDDGRSGTVEAGMHTAQERATNYFETQIGAVPRYADIERFLITKRFPENGIYYMYEDVWMDAVETVIQQTINLMNRKLRPANDIREIYVMGGGARIVFDEIQAMFPQAILADDPINDTAEGYRRWMAAKA